MFMGRIQVKKKYNKEKQFYYKVLNVGYFIFMDKFGNYIVKEIEVWYNLSK